MSVHFPRHESRGYARIGLTALLLLTACGGTPVAHETPSVDLAPRPRRGVRYEILHRETRQLSGREPEVLETRTVLEVVDVLPDGARRIRARLFRSRRDSGEDGGVVDEIVRFDLAADGTLVGEPQRECGAVEDLRLARYLRHLLGARAFVANGVGQGSRWRAEYLSDAVEVPAPATFRLDEVGSMTVRGRLSSRVEMEEGDIGAPLVSGRGRVRGRFTVSRADGFVGRTSLRSRIRGVVHVDGQRRRGTVTTRSQILVRRAERAADADRVSLTCDFDPSLVTAQIRRRLRAIQTCYERQLRDDPELAGRVLVAFTIDTTGRVRNAHATENSTGNDAVAACVVDTVSRFRFRPGPVGGPVTFAYPFVFAPQR